MRTVALSCLVAAAVASDHWAVVMSGSKGYSNYRHQSDAFRAVRLLMENGVARDHIIHLSYDDIAYHEANPFPGAIYNEPAEGEGTNVYDEGLIDFRGEDVNKENFFKVLLGDQTAPGPVLGSSSDSKVFIYYVDHGATGLICTP